MQGNPDNRTENLAAAVGLYSDMLLRVALNLLGNYSDAEDSVQETYLRYMQYAPGFNGAEHEKAWLLRVCINVSRNIARSRSRRVSFNIDELENAVPVSDEQSQVLASVMALPEKYRVVMDLYYIEGIPTDRIAELIGIKPAAVRKRLQKARGMLRIFLEE